MSGLMEFIRGLFKSEQKPKDEPHRKIQSGDKVTINAEHIMSSADWSRYGEPYKAFVIESVGKVFTARVLLCSDRNSNLVEFHEDVYGWLFDENDLTLVDKEP